MSWLWSVPRRLGRQSPHLAPATPGWLHRPVASRGRPRTHDSNPFFHILASDSQGPSGPRGPHHLGSGSKRAASLTCWPLEHHPVSQPSCVPLPASPTLHLGRLPILAPSVDSWGSPLPQGSPHPAPQGNCSAQHCAQCVGEEQSRTGSGGGVTGPGEFSPGWLFTCTQARIPAVVLWNLMSLIRSARHELQNQPSFPY